MPGRGKTLLGTGVSCSSLAAGVPVFTGPGLAGASSPTYWRVRVSTVSDDSTQYVSGNENAWAALTRQGYALTNDRLIGLAERFRQNFSEPYFNSGTPPHDEGDWPVDRQRARDVIRYQWRNDRPDVQRHDTITITDRAGIPGKREHSRVELLDDPQAKELTQTFLQLVPPSRRQADSTFSVNLFRTFTNVVTRPHQDHEEFIILYVLDRVGGGAETCLYAPCDETHDGQVMAPPLLRRQLHPGDIMIFEDKLFQHETTPLTNPPERIAKRDALVCTVDYWDTYLGGLAAN